MIVCHSLRFVFFCNPGTGSGTALRLLQPWAEEGVTEWWRRDAKTPLYYLMSPAEAEEVLTARGIAFRDYRRITLVMNPFTRLQALYRRIADTDRRWLGPDGSGSRRPEFNAWVRTTRPDGRGAGGRISERWRRTGSWSAEHWCAGRITDAIRTEDQETAMPALLAGLGVRIDGWPPQPPEPGRGWPTAYDQATAMVVARRYAADIARFGYAHPVLDWSG